MGKPVTVYEAKTHLSRILDDVESGAEYVVTRNGVPCAKVVPLHRPGKVPLGFVKGALTDAFFEPLPDAELAAWSGVGESGRTAQRAKKHSAKRQARRPTTR